MPTRSLRGGLASGPREPPPPCRFIPALSHDFLPCPPLARAGRLVLRAQSSQPRPPRLCRRTPTRHRGDEPGTATTLRPAVPPRRGVPRHDGGADHRLSPPTSSDSLMTNLSVAFEVSRGARQSGPWCCVPLQLARIEGPSGASCDFGPARPQVRRRFIDTDSHRKPEMPGSKIPPVPIKIFAQVSAPRSGNLRRQRTVPSNSTRTPN